MDSNINSSFIPTDAGRGNIAAGAPALYDLILLVSIVVLVASGALAAAVYLYGQYLNQELASEQQSLELSKRSFAPADIDRLTRLGDRLHAADGVLSAHIAPSGFFHMLEQSTLTTVAFSGLTFDASNPQNVVVKLPGVAESVNSIALQADVFTKGGALGSPIFSNIARRQDGVHFDLSATVNSSLIRYSLVHTADAMSTGAMPQQIPQGMLAPDSSGVMNATDSNQ
jgi:hypothetical protein